MHLLGCFIPNFGYARPQKLKISQFFQKMMHYSRLVCVVLLSHHSLRLVHYFSSFFFFFLLYLELGPSSIIIYFCLLPKKKLSTRYNRYFHSHIEDPVLYTVNYNTWQEGCWGDRREGRLHNTTQHTTQHYRSKLFSPLRGICFSIASEE